MPCDLTDMEVQILYILYRNTCFNSAATYHSEKLKKILRKKFDQDFDDAISNLKNKAYIAAIKKQEPKFYILDIGKAYSVLKSHNLNVTPIGGSRVHHLE
jgi:hypothetical protein